MKKFFFAIYFVFIAQLSFAQQRVDSVWESHFDRFIDSPHTAIRTEQIDHGHVGGCFIQIVTATDLISGKVLTGLHFADKAGNSQNLDADEVPSLLATMNLVYSKIIAIAPVNHAIVTFKSRSGFEAGCYTNSKGEWLLFFELRRNDNNTITEMKKEDLAVFIQILEQVKGQL